MESHRTSAVETNQEQLDEQLDEKLDLLDGPVEDDNDLLSFAQPHPPTPLPSRVPSPTFSRDPALSLDSLESPSQWNRFHGPLHPGALWVGTQKSGRQSFLVSVRVLSVDFPAGYLYAESCSLLILELT
jgi:hypothetical protein